MAMLYLNKRVEEVKNGTNRELLWILEHPTTYTAGVSFNKKESINATKAFVATAHSPCVSRAPRISREQSGACSAFLFPFNYSFFQLVVRVSLFQKYTEPCSSE